MCEDHVEVEDAPEVVPADWVQVWGRLANEWTVGGAAGQARQFEMGET